MKESFRKYTAMVDELKTKRFLAGITQKQLGESIGYARHTIRDLESLRHEPKAELLRKIAAYYGLPEDYFINLINKSADNSQDEKRGADPRAGYPETEEQICDLFERRENCRPRRCIIDTLKELMTLKDEVLERIFSSVEDALTNPANSRGCEFCSGRND